MIVVMGSTGHTGGRIVGRLLQAGERVRALGRSAAKLEELERQGAEVLAGEAGDVAYLTEAFRGADAAYVLLPPDLGATDYRAGQAQVSDAIAAALRASGVRAVVALSSLGAELAEGTGPIATLHDFEARLRALEHADLLILRPGYFFENFEDVVGLIREQGINAGSIDPDVAIPMIATRDIADAAVAALRMRDWRGAAVRELLGPRDLTMADATRILGARLGRPDLPYVRLSYDEMAAAFRQAGLSADVARAYADLTRAINDGSVTSLEGRSPANTTPTGFEDFVVELVPTDGPR